MLSSAERDLLTKKKSDKNDLASRKLNYSTFTTNTNSIHYLICRLDAKKTFKKSWWIE